ncbi:MAG: hypothetical protein OXI67_17315 [Candidatus Poribacteria bacterium]|nr:hypothetical protein [Candidatus Poribacteria bacterium]
MFIENEYPFQFFSPAECHKTNARMAFVLWHSAGLKTRTRWQHIKLTA